MNKKSKKTNPMYDLMLASDNLNKNLPLLIEHQKVIAKLRMELIKDAGLSPLDEMIVMDSMKDQNDKIADEFRQEICGLKFELNEIMELHEPEELDNDSLYMDDEGNIYLAGSEEIIGAFTVIESGIVNEDNTKFIFGNLDYGDQLTGRQIDQLARLKAVWVNQ